MNRKVEVDVTANDKTSRSLRSASRNLKQFSHDIDSMKRKTDDGTKANGNLSKAMLSVAKTTGRATSMIAGFASLAGPAAIGVMSAAKATAALGTALAQMAPAAAALPALAASLGLVALTAKLAGPQVVAAFTPVTALFAKDGKLTQRIGKLASKELPALSRAFVRVNMPAIASAMERVAVAGNRVILATGRWVNSAAGQETIRAITTATAAAAENLSGHVTGVAIAIGNLIRRVGTGEITKLGTQLGRGADAAKRFIDSLNRARVDAAFTDLAGLGVKLKATFAAIRDVGAWMNENTGKVKAFSDVLAGLAIVVGALSGNWVAVIAGGFSLVINHWQNLKNVFEGAPGWFSGIWQRIRNDPSLTSIWDSTKANWSAAWATITATVTQFKPVFTRLVASLKQAWADWGPTIALWAKNLKPVFVAVAAILTGMIVTLSAWAILQEATLHQLHGVYVWWSGVIAAQILRVIDVVGRFAGVMARLPGPMQGAFRAAATAAEQAKASINRSLAAIRNKTIAVNIVVHGLNDAKKAGSYVGGINGRSVGFTAPASFAQSSPDGSSLSRTGGPTPIVNATTSVFLDGQLIAAVARTEVKHTTDRAAWRARTGRR
jgi:hypothetical protein